MSWRDRFQHMGPGTADTARLVMRHERARSRERGAPRDPTTATRRSPPVWLGFLALWSLVILGAGIVSGSSLVVSLDVLLRKLVYAAWGVWAITFGGWRILVAVRRFLPGPRDPVEAIALEIGTGAGAAVLGIFALGALGLFQPWPVGLFLLALGAGNPFPWAHAMGERIKALRGHGSPFAIAIVALVGLMTALESLTPATSQDALVYHLALPDLYIRAGGITHIPDNFFASFPQNVEMLFVPALLFEGSDLTGFCHWFLGVGAVAAVGALARVAGGGGGLVAAAMFATVPTVALVATWAYVDLGAVLFQVLSVLCFLRWWRTGATGWLVLCGVHTGLAAGCKYTGGAIGVLLALAVLIEGGWRHRRLIESMVSIGLLAGVSLAVAGPWFVKNLIYTGNPVHPFLHAVFGGREWDSMRAYMLSEFLGSWGEPGGGLKEILTLPLRLTFGAEFFSIERFDGLIGPAFLLALPLGLTGLRRSPSLRLVLLVAVGFAVFWLLTTRQIRFLLPSLACVAAILGASHAMLAPGAARTVVTVALWGALAFNTMVISTHFAAHNPIPVVMGFEPEERFLEREIPGGDYALFVHIDRKLPRDARILFAASGNPGYLCRRDYHVDPIFENRTLKEILRIGETADGVLAEFRRRGYTHLLFRGDLVFDPSEKRSDVPLRRQLVLQIFLNRHCRLEANVNGTLLYAVRGPDEADAGGKGKRR